MIIFHIKQLRSLKPELADKEKFLEFLTKLGKNCAEAKVLKENFKEKYICEEIWFKFLSFIINCLTFHSLFIYFLVFFLCFVWNPRNVYANHQIWGPGNVDISLFFFFKIEIVVKNMAHAK